jgi:hypothetical protein
MTTETMKVEARLTAQDDTSAVLHSFTAEVRRMERSLKSTFSYQSAAGLLADLNALAKAQGRVADAMNRQAGAARSTRAMQRRAAPGAPLRTSGTTRWERIAARRRASSTTRHR